MKEVKNLHHANLVSPKGDTKAYIFSLIENNLDFQIQANPDFLIVESDVFGIDDARKFENWIIGKPLFGEKKVSAIFARSITHEAQNAMLKLLEEPPIGTYIFMCFQNIGNILPTFHSRVRVLDVDERFGSDKNSNASVIEAQKFFASGINKKLSIIRSLSKKENKDSMKDLIKNLEEISYNSFSKNKNLNIDDAAKMKKILSAKVFAASRGSSPKMLLEWLSCMI